MTCTQADQAPVLSIATEAMPGHAVRQRANCRVSNLPLQSCSKLAIAGFPESPSAYRLFVKLDLARVVSRAVRILRLPTAKHTGTHLPFEPVSVQQRRTPHDPDNGDRATSRNRYGESTRSTARGWTEQGGGAPQTG